MPSSGHAWKLDTSARFRAALKRFGSAYSSSRRRAVCGAISCHNETCMITEAQFGAIERLIRAARSVAESAGTGDFVDRQRATILGKAIREIDETNPAGPPPAPNTPAPSQHRTNCTRCDASADAFTQISYPDKEGHPRRTAKLCPTCLSFVNAAIENRPVYSRGKD